MPRGTLDRLLVILVLAAAAGGTSLFLGQEALATRCGVGSNGDIPPRATPTARAVPPRLRLPPRVSLGAFGDETLAAQGQPAVASTTASEDETMPDAGPAGLGLWRRTRQGWEKATWLQPATPREPALHPLVVTALEILLALMGCLALAGRSGRAGGGTAPLVRS